MKFAETGVALKVVLSTSVFAREQPIYKPVRNKQA
jgi:hypothetical protein